MLYVLLDKSEDLGFEFKLEAWSVLGEWTTT